MRYLLILLIASLIVACQNSSSTDTNETKTANLSAAKHENDTSSDTGEAPQLGDITLKVSGAAEAQPDFERGLLLLHSFEYEDAREAFLEAQQKDPNFAMAYWGEAMTFHHSLWLRQEKDKAIEALQKLASTKEARMAKVETELEKDFFEAAEILFGEGTKADRDKAYKDYMEQLTEKYPGNHEVSALYAISLLGASGEGRDYEIYGKSAKIAQGIIAENPNHPGALHYLIHAYDDPDHAPLAKLAADSYSKVAPDAAHALHMPSHIYVAMGLWDEVVTSNIASWNASVKRMQRKELDVTAQSYHALNWLQYGLLQRKEFEKATDIMRSMQEYMKNTDEKRARSYLVFMKGGQLVETGDWTGEFADIEVKVDDLNIVSRSAYQLTNGLKAYYTKDKAALATAVAKLEEDRKDTEVVVGDEGVPMCNAVGFASKLPSQLDIDLVKVMELELKAMLADLNGDKYEAQRLFREATQLDESLNYS
ncbi:MAG: hypothetical protein AAFO94_01215, partial [Bacteroidota bacterium]